MSRKALNCQAKVRVLSIVVAGGIFMLVMAAMSGTGQPYRQWHEAGPIQIVGGREEAWIFMEKSIVVHRPGWLIDHPNLVMGCDQEVIIITAKGVKSRISISDGKEVSFHKNTSHIFRQDNEFYLLSNESLPRPGSLFKWETDHFEKSQFLSRQEFLKQQGLDESKDPVFEPAIDRLTEKNDWKRLRADVDWIFSPFTFTWNGQPFEIKNERQTGTANVVIRSLGNENRWDDVLLQFDPNPKTITRDEYRKLWHREDGD